jgi:uncharacterized protein YdaU (DUF1376 family)
MATDFTRFDFHAKKFYFSENVRSMSVEEVGQYILLMVEAWMGGKDTTLPDNPKLLARMARVDQVSDAVLAMFPLVQTESGARRRNETLYSEWTAAVERSEEARRRALKGHGKEEAEQEQSRSTAGATCLPYPSPSPSPSQAESGQARPESSQLKPSQVLIAQPRKSESAAVSADLGLDAPDPAEEQEPNFKLFRRLWLNKKLELGRDKGSIEKYMNACSVYGTAKVHAAVDSWATEKTINWMANNNVRSQLGLFLSQLEKTIERMSDDKTVDVPMIEADAVAESIPDVLTTKKAVDATDAAILEMAAEEERQRNQRKEKFAVPAEQSIDPESFLGA